MKNYTPTINLLQKALDKNCHKIILVERQQFYSDQQQRFITMFILYDRTTDEDTGRIVKRELLKTANQIDVVKYMSNLYKQLMEEQGK